MERLRIGEYLMQRKSIDHDEAQLKPEYVNRLLDSIIQQAGKARSQITNQTQCDALHEMLSSRNSGPFFEQLHEVDGFLSDILDILDE